MRKGQLVRVRWMDIQTNLSTAEAPEPLVSYAVGRVLYGNKKMRDYNMRYAVLVSGWYEDQKDSPEEDLITIPVGCIESVEVLRDNG